MSARENLLAELEAKRREQAAKSLRVLDTDLPSGADDSGYDPYDNPGHAKPLDPDRRRTRPGGQKRR